MDLYELNKSVQKKKEKYAANLMINAELQMVLYSLHLIGSEMDSFIKGFVDEGGLKQLMNRIEVS